MDGDNKMENTLKLIKEYFDTNAIKYKTKVLSKKRRTVFNLGIDMENVIGNLSMIISVSENDYITLAILNSKAEKDKLHAVAEYLHRANYGLKNGNFELDFTDGEIRYKAYVNFENTTISNEIIEASIMVPIAAFEQYGRGLIQTMLTGVVADVE